MPLYDISDQDDTEKSQTLQEAIPKSSVIAEQQSRPPVLQKLSRREQLCTCVCVCVHLDRSYANFVRALSHIERLGTCSFANPRALFDIQVFSGAP